jgi:hypothetical protein
MKRVKSTFVMDWEFDAAGRRWEAESGPAPELRRNPEDTVHLRIQSSGTNIDLMPTGFWSYNSAGSKTQNNGGLSL